MIKNVKSEATAAVSARSRTMRAIRSKNTKPEMIIRKALHSLGYRFRLHLRKLPGSPDIVLPRYKTAVQVRGCFWHHHNCENGRLPRTAVEYWHPKLKANVKRDQRNDAALIALGYKVVVIWECDLKTREQTENAIEQIVLSFEDSNQSCPPRSSLR